MSPPERLCIQMGSYESQFNYWGGEWVLGRGRQSNKGSVHKPKCLRRKESRGVLEPTSVRLPPPNALTARPNRLTHDASSFGVPFNALLS